MGRGEEGVKGKRRGKEEEGGGGGNKDKTKDHSLRFGNNMGHIGNIGIYLSLIHI